MSNPVGSAIVVASGASAAPSPFPSADAFPGAESPGAASPATAGEALLGAAPCAGRFAVAGDAAARPSAKRGATTPFADALALEWAAALASGVVPQASAEPSPIADEGAPAEEPVEATRAEEASLGAAAPTADVSPASVAAAFVPPPPPRGPVPAPTPEPRAPTQPAAPLAATAEARPPLPPPPSPRGEVGATAVAPTPTPAAPRSTPDTEPRFAADVPAVASEGGGTPARAVQVEAGTHVTLELLRASAAPPRRDGTAERSATPTAERGPVSHVLDELELRSWPRAAERVPPALDRGPVAPANRLGATLTVEPAVTPAAATPSSAPSADAQPVIAIAPARQLDLPAANQSPAPVPAGAAASSEPAAVSQPPAAATSAEPTPSDGGEPTAPLASTASSAPPAAASAKRANATTAESGHASRAVSGSHRGSAATDRASADGSSDEQPLSRDPERGAPDHAAAASPSRTARRRDDPAASPPVGPRTGEAALQDGGPHAPSSAPPAAPAAGSPPAERVAGDIASQTSEPALGAPPPSSLRMTLEPAGGPRLEVRLEMRGEAVHASIVTGDDALRTELSSGRDDLRDHLRQQHLELGGFDVSTGPGGHGAAERDARDARSGLADERPSAATPPPPPRATGSARAVLDGTTPGTGVEGRRRALDVTV